MVDLNFAETFGINKIGASAGSWGKVFLAIGVVVFLLILIGGLVFWIMRKRTYFLRIPVFRKVGNEIRRVATYRARVVPIGRAGDALWFVSGVKKYLPAGNLQTGPNEYWFFVREDGEWINVTLGDLNEKSKELGIKFIHQDMRMQRLATDRLLEQRLMNKSFMEKFGVWIGITIVFLIVAVSMIIFMYQYSKIIDKTDAILAKAVNAEQNSRGGGGDTGQLIPASVIGGVPISLLKKKRRDKWLEREG